MVGVSVYEDIGGATLSEPTEGGSFVTGVALSGSIGLLLFRITDCLNAPPLSMDSAIMMFCLLDCPVFAQCYKQNTNPMQGPVAGRTLGVATARKTFYLTDRAGCIDFATVARTERY